MLTRKSFMKSGAAAILVAGAAMLAASTAFAQNWPQRPVTLIVSQSAGASPDVMARLVADRLSRRLGQGVVIENKPGGANVIGATADRRAHV
jgi:tripartite-type tricarboxylate transporter receptor subunit TctC